MFEFTLFRIPVRVEPWFWLSAFLLGGGLSMNPTRDGLISTALWIVIVFVSILVHEFGHALCSRKLINREPAVRLWAFGGLAYPNGPLNRRQSLYVSLAGPAAGLMLFLIVTLVCVIRWGGVDGLDVIIWNLFQSKNLLIGSGEAFVGMNRAVYSIISSLVFVNFWWSLVNLLPVFPLDGGQAYAAIQPSQKKVYQVGFYTGVAFAVTGLVLMGSFYIAIIFGFLAYQNWQMLQQYQNR